MLYDICVDDDLTPEKVSKCKGLMSSVPSDHVKTMCSASLTLSDLTESLGPICGGSHVLLADNAVSQLPILISLFKISE